MQLAITLIQLGRGMAIVGLALGGGAYWSTHGASFWSVRGRREPPPGPYYRGKFRVDRVAAVPLLVVGAIGAVLWIVGSLR